MRGTQRGNQKHKRMEGRGLVRKERGEPKLAYSLCENFTGNRILKRSGVVDSS